VSINTDLEKQIASLPNEITVVILHPAAYASHRTLSQLLLQSANAAYAHLPPEDLSVEAALASIQDAVTSQLQLKLDKLGSNVKDAAEKLAKALNQSKSCVLLIEGFDGERRAQLQPMIETLAGNLKPGRRVVLSGRELPTDLIESGDINGKLALLPVDSRRMLVDYVNPEAGKTFLEVRAFGQGQVWVNGKLVDRWEGHLPRSLFFFFIDRAMTTRDDIFNTFWPNLNTREATNVFHVTKRKVSEIINLNLTIYGAGFYRIANEIDLHYDVVNFQEAVQTAAVVDDDEAQELYQIAIDLYRDEFLAGMKGEWIQRRRQEMAGTYTEALVGLARICERRNEQEKALGLFLRASATAPLREDLIRGIMRMYHHLGANDRALEAYNRLVDGLRKSLNVSPDPTTVKLADEIKATK
jgi:DNA-binding SARP family transcriptional activator